MAEEATTAPRPRRRSSSSSSLDGDGAGDGDGSRDYGEERANCDAVPRSPVPLTKEEAENAEVRRLAAALSPDLVRAEELFQVPSEFRRHQSGGGLLQQDDDDTDDMEDEVRALRASEAMLRQELDLANDFSGLFDALHHKRDAADTAATGVVVGDVEEDEAEPSSPPPPPRTVSSSHSEADLDDHRENPHYQTPEQGLKPIRLPGHQSPRSAAAARTTTPPTTATPTASSARDSSLLFFSSTPPSPLGGRRPSSVRYTVTEHSRYLQLRAEERGGWYSVSLTRHLLLGKNTNENAEQHDAVKEYCVAVPEPKLRHLFVGVPDSGGGKAAAAATTAAAPAASPRASPSESAPAAKPPPLPVRTIAIRIRPDVLCGAVMEAVHHALQEQNAVVRKRQGGHCQAFVRGAVVVPEAQVEGEDEFVDVEQLPTHDSEVVRYPPFFVDVNLTTYKSDDCERALLLRIYHSTDDSERDAVKDDANGDFSEIDTLTEPIDDTAALHVRECAALIQRMESPEQFRKMAGRNLSPGANSPQYVQGIVSTHLLEQYRACPSVRDGAVTLPALNAEDFAVIQSSWRLVRAVWEELETRDLAYATLQTARFGAFPSLPTLDVHYCSQIRRISRENMIVQLLKSASDLEEYACEAEYACANMIALLKPTFEAYGVQAPSLPKATPLTEYPLDFTPPQISCPPWGDKVQHALNQIQAWTGEANREDPASGLLSQGQEIDSEKSLEMALNAVLSVYVAFQKQDDEEQSARLGRKNVQVMDRLAKMQAHQKLSIQSLQFSAGESEQAAKAAADFHSSSGVREVPLLRWSIVVGKATTGTCTVTANHILFVTQLIPVIGGSTTTLFNLTEVDFAIEEAPVSILNPLPTVVSVLRGGLEVYSFRPSMAGDRLKSFLDIVKMTAVQDPLDLPERETAPSAIEPENNNREAKDY